MRTICIGLIALALTSLGATPTLAQTGHDLYQQALVKEQADGDLRAAIALYERIVREFSSVRALAAKALVQMGQCHERLGSQAARAAYRQVVEEYADQAESAARARARLAVLTRPVPADTESRIQVRQLLSSSHGDPVPLSGGFFPDGRRLVYIDWDAGTVAVGDVATRETRPITQGDLERGGPTGAKVSPDGKLIAYYWYPVGKPADHASGTMLRLVGSDGSGDRLLQFVGGIGHGSWSWDSRHIAAVMHNDENPDTEIVWINVADGAITHLETFHYREKFAPAVSHSPDNRFLAVEFPVEEDGGHHDIVLLSTDGGPSLPLVDHPGDDRLFGWVPGADAVLFKSDRSGSQDLWAIRVTEGGIGGKPFPLMRRLGEMDPMGFGADGRLFLSTRTLHYAKSIAPFDESTGRVLMEAAEPILGTHDNSGFAWSPSGDSLALAYREEGGGFTIRLRDMLAGTERILTREINPATVGGPRWHPDGQSVLTVGMAHGVDREDWPNTPAGLYRIDVSTGEVNRVFDFPPDNFWWMDIGLTLTPDGNGVVYRHRGRLLLRDLESGGVEELFRHPDLSGPMKWSPDGSELLFGIADSSGADESPGRRRLMVLPAPGGEAYELLRIDLPGRLRVGSFNWTADGRSILFLQTREGRSNLMRISRDGGEPELLWESDERFLGLPLSPDHRKVGITTQTNEAEIWVMENLVEALREIEGGR